MATNPKSDLPPEEEIKELDNLTIIPGVNEALEQWLRESLKVYTFADLAKLSAQKIRARGKQTGEVLSIEELEPILAQARELAEASAAPATEITQPAKAKPEKVSAAAKTTKEWNDFANFVVCFEHKVVGGKEQKRTKIEHRTGIQHMETGKQASWPGVETDEACRWMLQRLEKGVIITEEKAPKIEVRAKTEEAPKVEAHIPTSSDASQSMAIEIVKVQVFQPPSTAQPQGIFVQNLAFTGYLKAGEALSFAVAFRIAGVGTSEAAKKGLEFSTVFNAVNLSTSTAIRLGASKPDSLKEDVFSYTAKLAPITLPAGMYQLKILTTIRDIQPIWTHAEVPLLHVI